VVESDAGRRGQHLRAPRIPVKSETLLGDGFFDGHLTLAKKLARKWVTAHEEQMEDQDSEPKVIVIGRANNFAEFCVLQFRRSVERNADFAWIECAVRGDLEAVAIDEADDCGFGRNSNVALIDVANHMAVVVNGSESLYDIGSSVD
jgi:hypothetical protein